jgi:hypothetical protein
MSLLIDVVKRARGKNIDKVDYATYCQRLKKCNGCVISGKKGVLPTGNCRECGCFVKDKANYKDEKCPLNKW